MCALRKVSLRTDIEGWHTINKVYNKQEKKRRAIWQLKSSVQVQLKEYYQRHPNNELPKISEYVDENEKFRTATSTYRHDLHPLIGKIS